MASRKDLKKSIHLLMQDLAMESYVVYIVDKQVKEEKLNEVLLHISTIDGEFVSRANHPNGTHDAKIVRDYYNQLLKDFEARYLEVVEEIKNLSK